MFLSLGDRRAGRSKAIPSSWSPRALRLFGSTMHMWENVPALLRHFGSTAALEWGVPQSNTPRSRDTRIHVVTLFVVPRGAVLLRSMARRWGDFPGLILIVLTFGRVFLRPLASMLEGIGPQKSDQE